MQRQDVQRMQKKQAAFFRIQPVFLKIQPVFSKKQPEFLEASSVGYNYSSFTIKEKEDKKGLTNKA